VSIYLTIVFSYYCGTLLDSAISLNVSVLEGFFITWSVTFLDILKCFCTNDISAQNLELHFLHLKRCFFNLRYVGNSAIFINKAILKGSPNPFSTILFSSFLQLHLVQYFDLYDRVL